MSASTRPWSAGTSRRRTVVHPRHEQFSARDVYTGRVLWKREFDDLGTYDVYYDETYKDNRWNPKYNQVHIPGANGRGTNYVVTEDRVYMLEGGKCHVTRPGNRRNNDGHSRFQRSMANRNRWGYIGVYEDVLIGGLGFAEYQRTT